MDPEAEAEAEATQEQAQEEAGVGIVEEVVEAEGGGEEIHKPAIFGPALPRRLSRYHELTEYAFGKRLGFWVLVPFQTGVLVGVAIAYNVLGGSSLLDAANRNGFYSLGESVWIVIFSIFLGLLAQVCMGVGESVYQGAAAAASSLCYSSITT